MIFYYLLGTLLEKAICKVDDLCIFSKKKGNSFTVRVIAWEAFASKVSAAAVSVSYGSRKT